VIRNEKQPPPIHERLRFPTECQEGIDAHNPSAIYAMFSGGHDSICSTHLTSTLPGFKGVVHVNTGIGIEATRDYVRDTCERFGWFLYELRSESKYEDLVLERGGFPSGPASHNSMLYYLKEKPLREFIQRIKTHRHDRIGLVTGIRVGESQRRAMAKMAVPVKRDGAKVWINPILEWDDKDKNDYMAANDLPRNQVTDVLHRSGECLCGALARREELQEIFDWYPKEGQRIIDLENEAKRRGIADHFWAMKSKVSAEQGELFESPLCVGCAQNYEVTTDPNQIPAATAAPKKGSNG
jgi:3'-phosphoadenosine 5'-phosphosulfate sulfotransferase (PAPS reductase)/FAD synthetase